MYLTGELSIGHVELAKHVAWRKGHFSQIRRIPSTHYNPPVCGVILYQLDALGQLVYALSCVVMTTNLNQSINQTTNQRAQMYMPV